MSRIQLLESIAATIADYRHGEIPPPDAAHVERWVSQFGPAVQEPMLAELDHVLRQSYLSQRQVVALVQTVAGRTRLTGGDTLWTRLRSGVDKVLRCLGRRRPGQWRDARLLQIQHHGASQVEMARLLREALDRLFEPGTTLNGSGSGPFVYIDDILFTGTRIIIDLHDWIRAAAPRRADVVIIVLVCYRHGLLWAHRAILRAAREAGKVIRLHWIRCADLENRHGVADGREGFHPACLQAAGPDRAPDHRGGVAQGQLLGRHSAG